MYVNVIFAKNMSKNHFYPICDALAQKRFNNSQTSLFMNKIFIIILLSTSVLSGKYRGGISRAVFPGKYRPVQYPQSGKYWEI